MLLGLRYSNEGGIIFAFHLGGALRQSLECTGIPAGLMRKSIESRRFSDAWGTGTRQRAVFAKTFCRYRDDPLDAPSGVRDRQSSIAFRIASGARLLHNILYSGIPPKASATFAFDIL